MPLRARLLVPVLALTAFAGCGSSSPSGNGLAGKSTSQIVAATKAAAAGAASVHVAGSIVNEGKPIAFDLELVRGKGGKGQISLGGVSVQLVQLAGNVYIEGSKAFYTQVAGPEAAKLLQGKWLKAPSSNSSFASLTQLTELGKLIDTTLSSHGTLKKSGTSTIDGRKVVGVTDTTRGGTLYVAATGTAYPIEIRKDGAGGGTIKFDRWNKPVSVTAPASAININQLQSGH
jgi:hypothetical protein